MTGHAPDRAAAGMAAGPAFVGMALAAGLGKRMLPLTADRPKPLISVGGRTLLDHALDRLAACGAGRAVVNVHYLADMVESHLKMRTLPLDIAVSDERTLLMDTGGGLVKARSLLGEGPIIVTNTDAIFLPDPDSPSLSDLLAGFDPGAEDARLILVPKRRAVGLDGNGDFHLSPNSRIAPPDRGAEAPYFYTGTQILNLGVLDALPEEPFSMWRIWDAAIAAGRLTGAVFQGDWLHVGDPEGLRAAEARLARPAPPGPGV